jgi:hypothetical protein
MRLPNQEIQRLRRLGYSNKQLKKAWEMAVGNENGVVDSIKHAAAQMERCATFPHIHGQQAFEQLQPYLDDINNPSRSRLKLALARIERATMGDPLAKTSLRGRAFVRHGVQETNRIFSELQQRNGRLQAFRGHDWHAHILGPSLQNLGEQRVQGNKVAWKPTKINPIPITDEGEDTASTYQTIFEAPFKQLLSGWRGTLKFTGEDKGAATPFPEYIQKLRVHRQRLNQFMKPLDRNNPPVSLYADHTPERNPTTGHAAKVIQDNPDIEQTLISTFIADDPFAFSMNAKDLSDVPLSVGNPDRPLRFLFPKSSAK